MARGIRNSNGKGAISAMGKDLGNASVTLTVLILHWTPKHSLPYGASEYLVKFASPNFSLDPCDLVTSDPLLVIKLTQPFPHIISFPEKPNNPHPSLAAQIIPIFQNSKSFQDSCSSLQ